MKYSEGKLHTCEQFKRGIVDAKGRLVASMDYAYLECDADRERMIACWNAFVGRSPKWEEVFDNLQDQLNDALNLLELLEIAKAERDKLKEENKNMQKQLDSVCQLHVKASEEAHKERAIKKELLGICETVKIAINKARRNDVGDATIPWGKVVFIVTHINQAIKKVTEGGTNEAHKESE